MTRRARGVFMAVLAAATLTAGCGHSGGDLPPASDPVAWAGRLCSSLQPLAALKGDVPAFDRNNPAESRQAMSQYFQRASDAAGQSLQGFAQIGPSPIQGGDDVANKLHNALGQLQQAYDHAKATVESVDPSDPVGMGTQLPGILRELQSATNNASLDGIGTNAALNDAIKQAPSCALGGPTSPGGN